MFDKNDTQASALAIWQDRWNSLNSFIENLAAYYGSLDFQRRDELVHAMRCLQAFAGRHFALGHASFTSLGDRHPLETPSPETSQHPKVFPEGALGAILDQVGFDLEVYQRIADQRTCARLAPRLAETDQIACKYLQPIMSTLESDNWIEGGLTTVMTYFQKSPNTRVIPYAPVLLVGLPFTCVKADGTIDMQECLSIPHELGHYVFWRGQVGSKLVTEALYAELSLRLKETWKIDPIPTWMLKWVEEIFADVYGCLLKGEEITKSCEEIQRARIGGEFKKDDGEHPLPALRPYVYYQILAKLNQPSRVPAWNTQMEARGIPTDLDGQQNYMVNLSGGTVISLLEVRQKMSYVVEVVYEFINQKFDPQPLFRESAAQVVTIPALKLKTGAQDTLWTDWKRKRFPNLQDPKNQLPDDPTRPQPQIPGLGYDDWKYVLKARQWTTRWGNGRWTE